MSDNDLFLGTIELRMRRHPNDRATVVAFDVELNDKLHSIRSVTVPDFKLEQISTTEEPWEWELGKVLSELAKPIAKAIRPKVRNGERPDQVNPFDHYRDHMERTGRVSSTESNTANAPQHGSNAWGFTLGEYWRPPSQLSITKEKPASDRHNLPVLMPKDPASIPPDARAPKRETPAWAQVRSWDYAAESPTFDHIGTTPPTPRGDRFVIDDPHAEQTAKEATKATHAWFTDAVAKAAGYSGAHVIVSRIHPEDERGTLDLTEHVTFGAGNAPPLIVESALMDHGECEIADAIKEVADRYALVMPRPPVTIMFPPNTNEDEREDVLKRVRALGVGLEDITPEMA